MKVVMGPTELTFNEVKSPILDDTLKIIDTYRKNTAELNDWLQAELKNTKTKYEQKQQALVKETEQNLLKHADKLSGA